jgi:plasmid maintenance system killer protein
MKVTLKPELEELFEEGRTKKYPIPPEIYKKFMGRIAALVDETTITSFRRHPFQFKKYKNHYSMRVNEYRLEMTVNWLDEAETIGEFHIFELSKHYGD